MPVILASPTTTNFESGVAVPIPTFVEAELEVIPMYLAPASSSKNDANCESSLLNAIFSYLERDGGFFRSKKAILMSEDTRLCNYLEIIPQMIKLFCIHKPQFDLYRYY